MKTSVALEIKIKWKKASVLTQLNYKKAHLHIVKLFYPLSILSYGLWHDRSPLRLSLSLSFSLIPQRLFMSHVSFRTALMPTRENLSLDTLTQTHWWSRMSMCLSRSVIHKVETIVLCKIIALKSGCNKTNVYITTSHLYLFHSIIQ